MNSQIESNRDNLEIPEWHQISNIETQLLIFISFFIFSTRNTQRWPYKIRKCIGRGRYRYRNDTENIFRDDSDKPRGKESINNSENILKK